MTLNAQKKMFSVADQRFYVNEEKTHSASLAAGKARASSTYFRVVDAQRVDEQIDGVVQLPHPVPAERTDTCAVLVEKQGKSHTGVARGA